MVNPPKRRNQHFARPPSEQEPLPPLAISNTSDTSNFIVDWGSDRIAYRGVVISLADAFIIATAVIQGKTGQVVEKLVEVEKDDIVDSGVVLVFAEGNIRRWTDRLTWSASRTFRQFLLYRETEEKPSTVDDGIEEVDEGILELQGSLRDGQGDSNRSGYVRPGGLIKRTVTIAHRRTRYRIVSYYSLNDVLDEKLSRPSRDPRFAHLLHEIPEELLEPRLYPRCQLIVTRNASGRRVYVDETAKPTKSIPDRTAVSSGIKFQQDTKYNTTSVSSTPPTTSTSPTSLIWALPIGRPPIPTKRQLSTTSAPSILHFDRPPATESILSMCHASRNRYHPYGPSETQYPTPLASGVVPTTENRPASPSVHSDSSGSFNEWHLPLQSSSSTSVVAPSPTFPGSFSSLPLPSPNAPYGMTPNVFRPKLQMAIGSWISIASDDSSWESDLQSPSSYTQPLSGMSYSPATQTPNYSLLCNGPAVQQTTPGTMPYSYVDCRGVPFDSMLHNQPYATTSSFGLDNDWQPSVQPATAYDAVQQPPGVAPTVPSRHLRSGLQQENRAY